jgi:hypothetical protein
MKVSNKEMICFNQQANIKQGKPVTEMLQMLRTVYGELIQLSL